MTINRLQKFRITAALVGSVPTFISGAETIKCQSDLFFSPYSFASESPAINNNNKLNINGDTVLLKSTGIFPHHHPEAALTPSNNRSSSWVNILSPLLCEPKRQRLSTAPYPAYKPSLSTSEGSCPTNILSPLSPRPKSAAWAQNKTQSSFTQLQPRVRLQFVAMLLFHSNKKQLKWWMEENTSTFTVCDGKSEAVKTGSVLTLSCTSFCCKTVHPL